MVSSVINRPTGAVAGLSTITKLRKYKGLHEGHHFILMVMEVHNTPGHDMDRFIKECALLSHDRQLRGHLSLYFCIQFFTQRVGIVLQHALTSTIKMKITLASGASFIPPILIKFHDLHAGNIKRATCEIVSYHERD